jgi:hypothetical protein
LECADVLAVLGSCAVILALIGLGFYAVWKMKPDSFRVRTSLLRMFTFSIEIGSSRTAVKSSGSAEHSHGLH